ncbi:hypothetical protein Pst134EB_022282 [Puccinia striiformis f. sp. tritici]|nr:hypothetical protein Pst134EB_022282 [Puccinia striiformis f. sp. tritici]
MVDINQTSIVLPIDKLLCIWSNVFIPRMALKPSSVDQPRSRMVTGIAENKFVFYSTGELVLIIIISYALPELQHSLLGVWDGLVRLIGP